MDVQVALANKPGGCVVWIFVDPANLGLGPFLWFGGEPGHSLPDLGDRSVKHTRGDATGEKKVRSALRRLPKGMFTRFGSIEQLAMAMFGAAHGEHDRLLHDHLARHGHFDLNQLVPPDLTWDNSVHVAHLIAGYDLAEQAGLGDPVAFLARTRAQAERSGAWSGTLLELWVALFLEHRRDHFQGPIGINVENIQPPMLDELCRALATKVRR